MLVCSCGSIQLILWGYYTRKLLLPDGLIELLRIHRVRCKDCGLTHAVLPVFLSGRVRHPLWTLAACLEPVIEKGYSHARALSWAAIVTQFNAGTLYGWVRRLGSRCDRLLFHLQAHLLFVQPDFDLDTLQAPLLKRRTNIAACWHLATAIIESDHALPEHTPLTYLNYFCWQKLKQALLDP